LTSIAVNHDLTYRFTSPRMIGEGRYFMTDEQKLATVGRVLTEKKEAEQHLAALESEASKLGNKFKELGSLLQSSPHNVLFDNVSINIKYAHPSMSSFQVHQIDGNKIVALTNDIRDTMEKVERLRESASRLGF